MTILDELAALARERHYGHELVERTLCRISKLPVDWCGGCKQGLHAVRRAQHRDPDFCPRCTPLYGTCRCDVAASE